MEVLRCFFSQIIKSVFWYINYFYGQLDLIIYILKFVLLKHLSKNVAVTAEILLCCVQNNTELYWYLQLPDFSTQKMFPIFLCHNQPRHICFILWLCHFKYHIFLCNHSSASPSRPFLLVSIHVTQKCFWKQFEDVWPDLISILCIPYSFFVTK